MTNNANPNMEKKRERKEGKLSTQEKSREQLIDKLTKSLARPLAKIILNKTLNKPVVIQREYDRELTRLRPVKKHLDYLFRAQVGETSLLVHFEFQSQNNKNMAFRMLEYAIEIYKRYKEYPFQVVIYLGNEELKMDSVLYLGRNQSSLYFDFLIIDLTTFDPEEFLDKNDPDQLLIAALCLKKKDPRARKVFEAVLSKINVENKQYYMQLLEIISAFKGLVKEFGEVREMFEIRIEELPSYKEGMQKGILETLLLLTREKYGLDQKEFDNLRKALEKLNEKQLLELTKLLISIDDYSNFKKQIENLK